MLYISQSSVETGKIVRPTLFCGRFI